MKSNKIRHIVTVYFNWKKELSNSFFWHLENTFDFPDSGNWSAEKNKALVASYWGKNVRNVFLHVEDTISVHISDGLFPFFLIQGPDKTILQLCGYLPYRDKEALISGGTLRMAGVSRGFTSIKIADSSTLNLQSKIDIFVFPLKK